MNPENIFASEQYPEPQHKPKITSFNDGFELMWECTDGGLTQYGRTARHAFENLKALR